MPQRQVRVIDQFDTATVTAWFVSMTLSIIVVLRIADGAVA